MDTREIISVLIGVSVMGTKDYWPITQEFVPLATVVCLFFDMHTYAHTHPYTDAHKHTRMRTLRCRHFLYASVYGHYNEYELFKYCFIYGGFVF